MIESLRWFVDSPKLNDNLKQTALEGYICGECMLKDACNKKKYLPKISKLSNYILHFFFNADKKNECFEFGFLVNQPDWFIHLYNICESNFNQMTKAIAEASKV